MNVFLKSKFSFKFWTLLLFLNLSVTAIGQAPIEWVQSVGDTCNQGFNAIIGTTDGGVILTGYAYINNQSDLLLSKLDEDGVIEWSNTYGGSKTDIGNSVTQTQDGGFVVVGTSNSIDGIPNTNNGESDVWILKVNNTGALIWSQVYGGGGFDEIASIQTTSDGGFILAGVTNSPTNNIITENAGKKDAFILRLDEQGDLMWSRTFGGSQNDNATAIQQNSDGEFIFAGTTWSNDIDISSNGGFSDMWLVKLQADGDLLWSKTFGSTGEDHANDMDTTIDGGFLLAGFSDYLLQSGSAISEHHIDFAVTKVDANGNLVWSNLYGGSEVEQAYGGIESSTGSYIISGYSSSTDGNVGNNYGFKDFWVLSLNANGDMNWSKNYGGSQNDFSTAITETTDGGLAFAGRTWSNDNDVATHGGIDDGWVIKLEGPGLPPTVDLGNDQQVCIGDTLSISAVTTNCMSCNFLWNDGNTDENRLLDLTGSETYTVTVTNEFGQMASDEINIIVNPLPSITNQITNPPCDNTAFGSIDLTPTSSNQPFTYLWNTGETTEDLNNLTAGNYVVTFTDSNNCSDILEVTLTVPTTFTANATTNQINCNGDNDGLIDLEITGGTSPYNYSWSNGATTEDVANLAAGNYTVTIEDANLCQEIQSFTITEPTAIQNESTFTDLDCYGDNNGFILLNVEGGIPPYNYTWSDGQIGSSAINLSAGNYSVTISDNVSCTKIETFTINTPSELLGEISASQIPCFSSSNGAIDLTVTGGTTPYTFAWSTGATTEDLENLPAGTYSVIITDDNNCNITEEVTIQMTNELVINDITNSVSCHGDTDGSIDISVSGGNGAYTYQWSNGLTTEDISDLAPGNYEVVVVDVSNCEGTASFEIVEPEPLSIQNTISLENCVASNDGMIELNVSGGTSGYTFEWSNQSTTQNLTNLTAGNYIVTITDANDCSLTESFQMMTNSAPQIGSAIIDASCFGLIDGSIDLSVTPFNNNYTYSWSNGPSSEDLQNLSAGDYTVTVNYGNDCQVIETFSIAQPLAISIEGITTNLDCHGDENGAIDLTVSGGSNTGFQYNWSHGSNTADLNNLNGGIYSIEITDSDNCMENATFEVLEPQMIILNGNLTQPTSLTSEDGAIQLFPSGGTSPYSLSWSNGATTFNPTNLSVGTYTVTLTDSNDCMSEATFTLSGPVGINELNLITTFNLFPNPTAAIFTVNASFKTKIKGKIIINNLLGQELDSYSFYNSSFKKEIAVEDFPSGIYLITLETEYGKLTERLIVQ